MPNKYILYIIFLVLIVASVVYYGYQWLLNQRVEEVVISTVNTAAEGAIAHIIKGEGLDLKHKLNISYKPMFPADVEREVYNRGVEVGAHGALTLATANLQGLEIRAFSPFYYNIYALLVRKDSPYDSVEDLKGRKLAVLPKITAAFTGPQMALALQGISLENDFSLVFTSPPKLAELLDRGDVEGAFFFETLASKMIATGKYREVFEVQRAWREKTGRTFPFLIFVAFEDWLKNNERIAKKYRRVYLEASNLIVDNPDILDKHREFFEQNLDIRTDEEMRVLKERFPKTLVTKWDQDVIGDIKYILDRAVEFGLLEKIPEKEIVLELK